MSPDGTGERDGSTLPLSQHLRVLQACDRFDSEWRNGAHPQIEVLLAEAEQDDRRPLLEYLISLEVSLRRKAGESPKPGDYYPRFPSLHDVIDAAFTDQTETAPNPDAPTIAASYRVDNVDDWHLLHNLLGEQHGYIRAVVLTDAVLAWSCGNEKGLREVLRERGLRVPAGLEDSPHEGDHAGAEATTLAVGSEAGSPGRQDEIASRERYQKGELHGRGGQADVFRATDRELGRQVALKALNHKYAASRRCCERLWQEAEIIGRLQHPGIVPVYGRGRTADGTPYYAMRFIDEENLAHAIKQFHNPDGATQDRRERALVFRRLLRRFIDVCNAVEYAHRHGVLHRDLKPTNIMLGEFGETLVIDWGLAKVIDKTNGARGGRSTGRDSNRGQLSPEPIDATQVFQYLGTVGYMSPEQADRRWDDLGPTSDIYSLGATLYCLLVGNSAFPHQSLSEFKIKVGRGEFLRPREVKGDVHPALEAVCLEAMALKPEDRFPSAKALAEELERWLDDEPLSCYVAPLPSRAARWVRRHKPLVTGAVALLVTATVGLGVSNVVVSEESRKAEQARFVAVMEKQKAERDRLRSEDSYQLTSRVLLDIYIKFAGEGLANIPHSEQLRLELAENAVDFARRLLVGREKDAAARRTAGLCYWWAANVHRNSGRLDRAGLCYDRSLDLLDGIDDPPALRPRAPFLWCLVAIDSAELLQMSGERAKAIIRLRNALERAGEIEAFEIGERFAVARAQYSLGGALAESGTLVGAESLCEAAAKTLTELIESAPKPNRYRLASVEPLLTLASIARQEDRFDDARGALDEALEDLEALGSSREFLSDVLVLTARVRAERGRLLAGAPARRDQAADDLDRAVTLLEDLASKFPETPSYSLDLASARVTRAEVYVNDPGRRDQARRDATAVKASLEPIPAAIANRRRLCDRLSKAHETLGRIALDDGEFATAEDSLRRALELQSESVDQSRGDAVDPSRRKGLEDALKRAQARR